MARPWTWAHRSSSWEHSACQSPEGDEVDDAGGTVGVVCEEELPALFVVFCLLLCAARLRVFLLASATCGELQQAPPLLVYEMPFTSGASDVGNIACRKDRAEARQVNKKAEDLSRASSLSWTPFCSIFV